MPAGTQRKARRLTAMHRRAVGPGPALQKQEFSLNFTIDQFHRVRSAQLDGAGRIHCLTAPGGATALAMAAVGVAPSAAAGASGASVGTLGGMDASWGRGAREIICAT